MHSRAQEIFAQGYELADPEQRSSFLDAHCGDDADLRREVERMIEDAESADSLFGDHAPPPGSSEGEGQEEDDDATGLDLGVIVPRAALDTDRPAGGKVIPSSKLLAMGLAGAKHPLSEQEGDVIGPYTLREKIGEGGFGVVWMAEQSEPISRMVALKVVKAGMDTDQVLARFEAERQALAMMEHPNIARVLDAGATVSGRPYFAMELVKGVPITTYCQEKSYGPRRRLDLLSQVCDAISHAHQKGIIHRDLKPSNVMVTTHGSKPVPKVIDFGIAKAMGPKLTDKTLFTRFEQFMGTPAYMSPEQTSMSGLDVDTRADIYSLGILLYELLTGAPPFDAKTLLSAGFDEMRRIIKEDDPPKPSTRLTETRAGEGKSKVPEVSPSSLRGDLDWIVMKAMDKDRGRRYATANELAADIGRYLEDEPVLAAAPSTAYKLRKFVRRNKGLVTTMAAVFVALVGGVAVTRIQADRATEARQRAEASDEKAQKRLTQVEKANDILSSIFVTLDPSEIAEADRPLQEILVEKLDLAAEQLDGDALGDPMEVADMQGKLGTSLAALGEPRKAIEILEKALATREKILGGENLKSTRTLATMDRLAVAYLDAAQPEEAIRIRKVVVAGYSSLHGEDAVSTLLVRDNLASALLEAKRLQEARATFEATYAVWEQGVEGEVAERGFMAHLHNSAMLYSALGDHQRNLDLTKKALDFAIKEYGSDHPHTLASKGNLADAHRELGNFDLAISLNQELMESERRILGDHPEAIKTLLNLASTYEDSSQPDKAIEMVEEALRMSEKRNGVGHPSTFPTKAYLGELYRKHGQAERALDLLQELAGHAEEKLGAEHERTLTIRGSLLPAYEACREIEEGLKVGFEVLDLKKQHLGEFDRSTLSTQGDVAKFLVMSGRKDEGTALLQETVKAKKEHLGPTDPDTFRTLVLLVATYNRNGSFEKAIELGLDSLPVMKEHLGILNPRTQNVLGPIFGAYMSTGRPDKAVELMEPVVETLNAELGPTDAETIKLSIGLGRAYLESNQAAKAVDLYRKALEACRESPEANQPSIEELSGRLGRAYHSLKKYDLAIPLFEEQVALSEKLIGRGDPRTIRALHNLTISYMDEGLIEKARPLVGELVDHQRNVLGQEVPKFLDSVEGAAYRNWTRRQPGTAAALYELALPHRTDLQGRDHVATLKVVANLGVNYQAAGQHEPSLPFLEEAYAAVDKDPELAYLSQHLVKGYARVGQKEQALEILPAALADIRGDAPTNSPELAGMLATLALTLLEHEMFAEAEALIGESLEIRKTQAPDAWTTFNAQSMLGGALLGQGKLDEAGPLLREGLAGMEKVEASVPGAQVPAYKLRLSQALERLVQFHEKRGGESDAEKANRFRMRLEKLRAEDGQ